MRSLENAKKNGVQGMAQRNMVEAGQGSLQRNLEDGPIDLRHLEQQSLGDPGLQEEVLRLYSDMSGVYLTRIEESATPEDMLKHLHTLKSAAAGIGAWQVRDLARHAEDALREGASVDPDLIADVARAVRECQDYIADFVSSLD